MSRKVRVKPGKGQSMAGFFMGLVFCGFAFFFVMPNSGPFGAVGTMFGAMGTMVRVMWTLFAVIITIVSGVNAFSNKGIASHEITVDEEINSHSTDYSKLSECQKSSDERMEDLQRLYDRKLISEDEYQNKRKQILKDI